MRGLLLLFLISCTPASPAESKPIVDGARLLDFASRLEACRRVGLEAGSYAAYSTCEVEAGLK